jgi:hypothetical protein
MCLTSVNIDGKGYLGVAWEDSSGKLRFTRAPFDATKPGKVNFDEPAARTVTVGDKSGFWSYGCYTDQSRKYFWGTLHSTGTIFGINLRTLEPLDPAVHAPNKGFTSTNATIGAKVADPGLGKSGSYALNGDAKGNVLTGSSGAGMYTYTHDSRTDVVFGSSSSLLMAKGSCFSSDQACDGKAFAYQLKTSDGADVGRIGPMSSFNDGRVVGIVRGYPSQVYVVRVADPNDLSKPPLVTRGDAIEGNAYMYNDFTGFSLYARDLDMTIELDKIANFDPALPVKAVSFTWAAQGGGDSKFEGLTFEARCYKSGQTPGAFTEVSPVNDSGKTTAIDVESCQGGLVNRLDIRLRAKDDAGSNFTRTSYIKIFGIQ